MHFASLEKFRHTHTLAQRSGLHWGNQPVSKLMEGREQPAYIYDQALLLDNIATLKSALPSGIELHYAIKANSNKDILSITSKAVDGFDVASLIEMEAAIKSGMTEHNISFAGPGKSEREIAAAIDLGVTLHIESPTEFKRIETYCKANQKKAYCALRINPPFSLHAAGMKMSGAASPFGLDISDVAPILANIKNNPLIKFRGFHVYSGSQNLTPEHLIESFEKTADLMLEYSKLAPNEPEYFNIGGGFGVPYYADQKSLDINPICGALTAIQTRVKTQYTSTKLVIELGRYLVAEAGIYACKILDIKQSGNHTYVVTNGGLHHHLSAAGLFGQVIPRPFPITSVEHFNDPKASLKDCHIVGPLCTPLDQFAKNYPLGNPQIGDHIAIMQSGAYGPKASPKDFLSHSHPDEIIV